MTLPTLVEGSDGEERYFRLIDGTTGNPWRGPVSLVDAAFALGLSAATLRQQIANGKLRATKRGRDWWVTRREVERYRQESRRS
jgi:excisionase family DNA binding protein